MSDVTRPKAALTRRLWLRAGRNGHEEVDIHDKPVTALAVDASAASVAHRRRRRPGQP